MHARGHVIFRAPSLVEGTSSSHAVAKSLQSLRGVSEVTLDVTSGAVVVRFDPELTTAAAVRARAHAPPRPSGATADVLLAAGRWVPLLTNVARIALGAMPG